MVKHTNPCGASVADSVAAAASGAMLGDPVAAYGGIMACSHEIDAAAAEVLTNDKAFLEVVAAPAFSDDALACLRARWKNVRLLALGAIDHDRSPTLVGRHVAGGRLVQERDTRLLGLDDLIHAAGPAPDEATCRAALLADQVGRSIWSNAVCIVVPAGPNGPFRLAGVGAGQVDRVTASRIAVDKAGGAAIDGLAYSDAFFPFPDGPELLIDAGVRTIVHPGGSKRDGETFDLCNERGVTCLTTGVRRFRH